jgi:hypothetical protein
MASARGFIEDGREIKLRLGLVEQQGASIARRVDRLDLRLERVERRLDSADADTHAWDAAWPGAAGQGLERPR